MRDSSDLGRHVMYTLVFYLGSELSAQLLSIRVESLLVRAPRRTFMIYSYDPRC